MKIAIMQPYFMPYIGYFQLINAVDKFVIYDNIQYSKRGWINRNRILVNGKAEFITLPLKKDSDYLDVVDRELALNFEDAKNKILRKVRASYQKAPYFDKAYELITDILSYKSSNLFDFVLNSIKKNCNYLGINTKIIISSDLEANHSLNGEERVIDICKNLKAKDYINPIGGVDLYTKSRFIEDNINLQFLETVNFEYNQNINYFLSHLSIIDLIMFNSREELKEILNKYILK